VFRTAAHGGQDNTVILEGTSFKHPRNLPAANKRIDVHVLLHGALSFSTKKKKLPASIPKRRTHLAYLERTASGKDSAIDLFLLQRTKDMNFHPDIFLLLLT
jgi:hypothetical protein